MASTKKTAKTAKKTTKTPAAPKKMHLLLDALAPVEAAFKAQYEAWDKKNDALQAKRTALLKQNDEARRAALAPFIGKKVLAFDYGGAPVIGTLKLDVWAAMILRENAPAVGLLSLSRVACLASHKKTVAKLIAAAKQNTGKRG